MLNCNTIHRDNWNWSAFIMLIVSLVPAAALRIGSAWGDLWLDEIWSLQFAQYMSHVWEVVTKIHHDNNHVLNTLYLYFNGDHNHWVLYRMLSVVTGLGTLALLGLAMLRRSSLETFTILLLTGFSYPLILYASEARGYAQAAFFSVASFLLLQEYWRQRRVWILILFWVSVIFGFLSHLTFLYVYVSLILWSFVHDKWNAAGKRAPYVEFFKCHGCPVLIFGLLYLIHIRHVMLGGWKEYKVWDVIHEAIQLLVGTPERGILTILGCFIFGLTVLYGIVQLYREKSNQWIFFLSVLILAPPLILVIKHPKVLYFRYFVVCVPFFYLLLCNVLTSFYQSSRMGKAVYVIIVLVFLSGNLYRTGRLLVFGRGNYRKAVQYLARETPGEEIVVGSDNDFRNKMVLAFYARFLPEGKRMLYVDQDSWPQHGTDWLIGHSQDVKYQPPTQLVDPKGNIYSLARSFPYSGMSGWHWFLYRNRSKE